MFYIIIQPTQENTAKQIATFISRQLMKLARPQAGPNDVASMLFAVITKDTEAAILVKEGMVIPIRRLKDGQIAHDFRQLAAAMITDIDERRGLKRYIKRKNRVAFSEIIPTNWQVKTRQQMKKLGWIPDEDDTLGLKSQGEDEDSITKASTR